MERDVFGRKAPRDPVLLRTAPYKLNKHIYPTLACAQCPTLACLGPFMTLTIHRPHERVHQ